MRFSTFAAVGILVSACGGKVAVDREEQPRPRLEPSEGFTCDELPPSEAAYYCLGVPAEGCEPAGSPTLDMGVQWALVGGAVDDFAACVGEVEAEIDGQDSASCAPDNQGLGSTEPCSTDAACWCYVAFAGTVCGPDPGRSDLCCYFVRTREDQLECP